MKQPAEPHIFFSHLPYAFQREERLLQASGRCTVLVHSQNNLLRRPGPFHHVMHAIFFHQRTELFHTLQVTNVQRCGNEATISNQNLALYSQIFSHSREEKFCHSCEIIQIWEWPGNKAIHFRTARDTKMGGDWQQGYQNQVTRN